MPLAICIFVLTSKILFKTSNSQEILLSSFCPSYCQVCDIFGRPGKFHQRRPILKNFPEGEKPILKIETLNPLSRVLLNATHSLVENKILINVRVQNFML